MPKLAMKRKKTKTTWIHSWLELRTFPRPVKIEPAAPHQVPPWKSQIVVTTMTKKTVILNQNRQNQARRWLITSSSRSCWLSRPNRLGHGIMRWKIRSTKPRNTTRMPNVASAVTHQFQPFCCLRKM